MLINKTYLLLTIIIRLVLFSFHIFSFYLFPFFATRMSWNLKLVTRIGIMKQKRKKVYPVKTWKIVQDKNSAEIWQESDVSMKNLV